MPPLTKKLTLKEVAQQLGVSTATVSNAFNRPDQLSAKLRDKILQESAQLGYHGPNLAARSLRRGESGVIGVMLADSLSFNFSDPTANQLLQGIAEVLVERNKQLLLMSSDVQTAEQSCAESLPDGFIFYGAPKGTSFDRIVMSGKPVVAVDFTQEKVGSVNIDNYQATMEAAETLIKSSDQVVILGLRIIDSDRVCRLLASDLKTAQKDITHQRLFGYLDGASASGVSIPPDHIWHIPLNAADLAEQAAHEALTMSPRPSILFCMSDVVALAAIRVATRLGIDVPSELRVVGFDDIPESSRSTPSLTSISQRSHEKGRMAARMLLDQSEKTVLMDTQLVERDSSAV